MTYEYNPETYHWIKQERERFREYVESRAEELGINMFAFTESLKKGELERLNSDPDKKYLSFAFGKTAYAYQLETYCKPKESIDYATSVVYPDEDVEWIKKAKNARYGFNEVIMKVLLEENDYFDSLPAPINLTSVKKDVSNSRSLNQGLRKLHGYQMIEKELTDMKRRIAALEAAQANTKIDVESIKSVVDVPDATPKERAKIMKSKGCTIKAIAQELNINRKTVSRWLKE